MKLNARIRIMLKELNHWHCIEAFEKQGVLADDIRIFKHGGVRGQPGNFVVSYRCYDPKKEGEEGSQQYWYATFGIRENSNPTEIGRKLGIHCKDRRIYLDSRKGKAIDYFLHRVAWIDACRLTEDRSQIQDETRYRKPVEKTAKQEIAA